MCPADALRVMPGFMPVLIDCRHEGIDPKCLLPGVSLDISGYYRGPIFANVPMDVQGCLGQPYDNNQVWPK